MESNSLHRSVSSGVFLTNRMHRGLSIVPQERIQNTFSSPWNTEGGKAAVINKKVP